MSDDEVPPVIRAARDLADYQAIGRAHAAFCDEMRAVLSMPYHEWVRRTFGPFGPMHTIDPRIDDSDAAFDRAAQNPPSTTTKDGKE